jgi:hypothetical protein
MTERDTWTEPDMRLIEDDRAPAPGLDDEALPAGWGNWIADEAEARGCPHDYVAAGLIAAASSWIGNSRDIGATSTWTEPPHLWFALVGAPSTGKTPALRPFVEVSRAIEREAEPAWHAASADHVKQAEVAKVEEEQWRNAVRAAAKDQTTPPDRPPGADPPTAPPRPRVIAMDATTEELQCLLAEQPRGLLYMRDELVGWLGNHDRYGGKGGDRAFFLEAWNGGAYVADRVKYHNRPVRIERTSLAILGGMQPDRLRQALAGADDGLAARLAYVWPNPVSVSSLARDGDTQAFIRRDLLMRAARYLCALRMDSASSGERVPRTLRLDRDAFDLFDELRRESMERARTSRGLAAGWHGKTPGRALRVALAYEFLTLAVTSSADPQAVSADAMVRAGGYLDYLAGMLDRVTAGLTLGCAEADAATIARHLLAVRPGEVNERALYQRSGWAWLRDAKRRAAAFSVLVEAGFVRAATRASNGRRRGDWLVSPRLPEMMP